MCEPTSPASTGGAGTAFENLVGAAFLATLLVRGAPLALGAGTLEVVHLQAGHLGFGTDDFLLEAAGLNGRSKAVVQAKRTFLLSQTNPECVQTLTRAFADFRNQSHFDQARDVIVLVTSSLSAKLTRGLRILLDCAQASVSSGDMERRLALPEYLGKPTKKYYEEIFDILRANCSPAPDADEVWRFLRRFCVFSMDLDVTSGMTETLIRSMLVASTPGSDASQVDATWNQLVTVSMRRSGSAATFRRDDLPAALLERHGRHTGFPSGVTRLREDTTIVSNFVRDTIGATLRLTRSGLISNLCQMLEDNQVTLVVGEAGSGKSVAAKGAFEIATNGSLGIAFRAESLAGVHINEILQRYSLTLEGLQGQTAMQPRKVLWIESVERLLEKPAEQRVAFLDLLRALRQDPSWRFLVTCRSYSADTVKNALFGELGIAHGELLVGELSDAELDEVAASLPTLRRPFSSPPLRDLLKRPFYLDKAARMDWPESEPLPANEREFRKKVWQDVVRKNHEGQSDGSPNRRGHVMIQIALRRARAMEPFVPGGNEDPGILHRLAQDSLLSKFVP